MTYRARSVSGGNGAAISCAIEDAQRIKGHAYQGEADGLSCVVVFASRPKSLGEMVEAFDAYFTCGRTSGRIIDATDLVEVTNE